MKNQHGYNAKQIIERVNATIMSTKNLSMFGGPLLTGQTTVTDSVKTAATDGYNTKYNPDFVVSIATDDYGSLYIAPAVFVAMHEVGHKVLRHVTTCYDLFTTDALLANASADYAINLILMDLIRDYPDVAKVMQPPRNTDGTVCMLYDEKYRGMSTRQIFAALRKDKDAEQKQKQAGEQEQGQAGEQEQAGEQAGGTGQAQTPMEQELVSKMWDEHDRAAASDRTPEEKARVERDIDQAVRQSTQIAGRLGGDVHHAFAVTEPDVDWEEALDSFIKQSCAGDDEVTTRMFNRKVLHLGLYQPTTYSEKVGRIGVFIDTSGSTTGELLNKFMANLASIVEQVSPEELLLGYWDTQICAVERYREGEYDRLLEATKPAGGGGTSPACIPLYIASDDDEDYDCIVIFTDGVFYGASQGDWSAVTTPVLWCVLDDGYGSSKAFTPDHGVKVGVKYS